MILMLIVTPIVILLATVMMMIIMIIEKFTKVKFKALVVPAASTKIKVKIYLTLINNLIIK